MTSQVWWNPSALNAAIDRATKTSFRAAHADALARRKNTSKSNIRFKQADPTKAVLIGTGLQPMFEKGREAGYAINPSGVAGIRRSRSKGTVSYGVRAGSGDKTALKFTLGDGGFAAYVEGGAMRPYPAMGPAAEDWARNLFRNIAKPTLAASGFRTRL